MLELGDDSGPDAAARRDRVRSVLDRCGGVLAAGRAVRVAALRAESDRLAAVRATLAASPATADAVDAAAYVVASLEAVLTVRPPARPVRLFPPPAFAPERDRSWVVFLRTGIVVGGAFLVWDATAWEAGEIFLISMATLVTIPLTMEDPLLAMTGLVTSQLVSVVLCLAALFLVLPMASGPLWLCAVLVPMAALSAWLGAAGLPMFSLVFGNALGVCLAPSNVQSYNLTASLELAVCLTLAAAAIKATFAVINPGGGGAERVRYRMRALRRHLSAARRSGPGVAHDRRLTWETQTYDEIRRIQAAHGDAGDRRAAVRLLLAGRATFRGRPPAAMSSVAPSPWP